MWVFTTEGFVSAVQHRDDDALLVVRARSEHALEALAERATTSIRRTPDADYPFRTVVDRSMFTQWVDAEVAAINYTNFKDAAHGLGDKRYDQALMKVWSAMYESESDDSRAFG